MSIQVMADNNVNIKSNQDAGLYHVLSGYTLHGIMSGVGNEMNVSFHGLRAILLDGQAYAYGHHITSDNATEKNMQANSSFKLVLRIDLTKPAGNEGSLETVSVLENENLLNGGLIYDIPLFDIITGSDSVTSSIDLRKIDTRKLVYFKEKVWD